MITGKSLAIRTSLLWEITLGLSLLAALFIFLGLYIRSRLSARASYIATRKKELAPMISTFIFYEEDASSLEKKEYIALKIAIRDQLKNEKDRHILSVTLLDLQKDISGKARERLYGLYANLGLQQDAFAKLKSWRWEVVSQGISELTQMQVAEAYSFIKPFINHKKAVIRKQAQLATVRLRPEGIAYFLDTIRYRISEWQQMKLMEVLNQWDAFTPPRFRLWLTAGNPDVILFSLRLIKHYRQNDASKALLTLTRHRDDRIKIAALECIREFGVAEVLPMLKRQFSGYRNEVKMAALDTFSTLGCLSDLIFLKSVQNKESNTIIKSKIVSIINSISPDAILPDVGIPIPRTEEADHTDEPVDSNRQECDHMQDTREDVAGEADVFRDPEEWQGLLEEDALDEALLAWCCHDELEEILTNAALPDRAQLDLSFLPLVDSENSDNIQYQNKSNPKENLYEMEVEATEVDAEETFRIELETILSRIAMFDPMHETNQTWLFDLNFLPLVSTEDHNRLSMEDAYGSLPEEDPGERETSIAPEENAMDMLDKNMQLSEKKRFCIFEELFRHCDADSKLILLDEILAVGGRKELWFLESLDSDADSRVRKKAGALVQELKEILEKEASLIAEEDLIREPDTGTAFVGDIQSSDTTATEHRSMEYGSMEAVTPFPEEETSLFEIDFELLEYSEDPYEAYASCQPEPEGGEQAEDGQAHLMENFIKMLGKDYG